jgi:hypothetical protein
MSYALEAIAVELAKVSRAIGSKNNDLLDTLITKYGWKFHEFDDMAADFADEDAGEKPLTMRSALSQLIMGDEYTKRFGFLYGYALSFICQHVGDFLPNSEWTGMRWEWAEEVDRHLESVGVPESVFRVTNHLMTRGSPIPIPPIDDFPAIGILTLAEIKAAHQALAQAKLGAIEDGDARSSIEQIIGWFKSCLESQRDLVCFYA